MTKSECNKNTKMETLDFRANCKTSCAKQNKKSAPKKLNLLHNLCNLQTKQERQRVEKQLPKFSPTFVFCNLCGEVANVGKMPNWVAKFLAFLLPFFLGLKIWVIEIWRYGYGR